MIDLSYDTAGNVLSTKQTDPSVGVVQTFFTYEPVFIQVTSITDPEGNTTTISYDVNGNPTQITDALTNTTSLVYDSRGLLTSVTDVLGNVTTFTYDGRGNLITTTDPLGNTTSLSYDAAGNVVSSSSISGTVTAETGFPELESVWVETADPTKIHVRYSYPVESVIVY